MNFRPGRISIVSCAWRLLIQLGYQNPQLSESTVLSTTLNFKQNPPRNAHNRWRRQIIYSTDLKPSTLIMSTAARRRLMRDFKVRHPNLVALWMLSSYEHWYSKIC